MCHGGGRRKGRGEPGSARERAPREEGGREADPPTWGALACSRLACRGRESPGEADKCGHIGCPGAPRGAHGPRRLSPVEAAPARCSWPRLALAESHGHSAGLRSRGSPPGSLPRAHAAAAAPWAHHGGNACRVPTRRPPPEPKRRLSVVLPQLPGPCPPARPLRPQLSMAQPPSLDHAQKLSKVDLLRVSLLWRPLREARVSIPVGGGRGGGRRGTGSHPSLLQRTWGPELVGEGVS